MTKLIFLGTANAIPDELHENTHLALLGADHRVLIDCASNPVVRLHRAGIDVLTLTDIILTHFHPDHISGAPSLLMNSWLLGRKQPLNVYGLDYTLSRFVRVMEAYDWSSWPGFFPVILKLIPEQERAMILNSDEFNIYTSQVHHMIPNIGIRVEFQRTKRVLVYSCDTEPCQEVVRLASRADVLIHEASGEGLGHSSAAQAGQIANDAEVGKLYLIHYPVANVDKQSWEKEARQTYRGPIELAADFMELEF